MHLFPTIIECKAAAIPGVEIRLDLHHRINVRLSQVRVVSSGEAPVLMLSEQEVWIHWVIYHQVVLVAAAILEGTATDRQILKSRRPREQQ